MTREEAKELLPIIQAFAAGKQIQDSIEGLTDWVDTDEINLEYEGQKIKHRIKPEPKYRPFKSQEECWQEMLKHQPFGWLKSKKDGRYRSIGELSWSDEFETVYIAFSTSEALSRSSNSVYDEYTFADGTPFGIKEEQNCVITY